MKNRLGLAREERRAAGWPVIWRRKDLPAWVYANGPREELGLDLTDVFLINPPSDEDGARLGDWLAVKDASTFVIRHLHEGRRQLVWFGLAEDAVTLRRHFGDLTRPWDDWPAQGPADG
jgi:hypothetical protein